MRKDFILIMPDPVSNMLKKMVQDSTKSYEYTLVKKASELPALKNKRILFAIELGNTGLNIELFKILKLINETSYNCMEGAVGAIFIHSNNEFFTKSIAQQIILYTNMVGCSFPGRPLVEITGQLKNFVTLEKFYRMNSEEVCLKCCNDLVKQLLTYKTIHINNPNILVLHSSNRKTSNTLMMWNLVKKHITTDNIKEIHIENGTVVDCKGCPFKTCSHYGSQTNCFYGGVMVEEVYPAILECDKLVLLCPNYNDAVSANISAVINRLTALFRLNKFYEKYLFSIVVSGHSGSDIVTKQLISALNINKTFRLPPHFSLMETANDPGSILLNENIYKKAESFANIINSI